MIPSTRAGALEFTDGVAIRDTIAGLGIAATVSEGGFITFASEQFATLAGCETASLIGHSLASITAPAEGYTEPAVIRLLRPSGEACWVRETRTDVTYEGRQAVLSIFNDITKDILERQRLAAELARASAALEGKSRDLEAIAYSISHDLKEPLRAIGGFSEFLAANYAASLDERGRDLLIRISRAGTRMKQLIDDLAAISRAASDTPSGPTQDINLIAADVARSFADVVRVRGGRLTIGPFPPMAGDARRVQQILLQLLSNAFKFNTSAVPSVEIALRQLEGGVATLTVRDNGVGIDPQYHERIFGLFQRLHTREEFEGNGAGLAVARRTAEGLGGSLSVESALGQGSTFVLRLPVQDKETRSAAA